MVELWACAAKLAPEYGNAWTNLKVSNLVTKWTGHPLNSTFKASGIDPGLLPLKYKDLQAQEKQTVFLQNCAGAIAAIGTRMLGLLQAKCKDLETTAKEYRDGSVQIEDPREEAAQIFEALRDTLMGTWAPDLSDLTKITAAQYNSMLLSRR